MHAHARCQIEQPASLTPVLCVRHDAHVRSSMRHDMHVRRSMQSAGSNATCPHGSPLFFACVMTGM